MGKLVTLGCQNVSVFTPQENVLLTKEWDGVSDDQQLLEMLTILKKISQKNKKDIRELL